MTTGNDAYRKLQEHLDRMPVGFPPTESGVEINLLKTIFTPKQARIALYLDHKHKTLDQVWETARAEVGSREELIRVLDETVSNGGITRRTRDGQTEYALLPLVLWGMYEHQLKRLTPEFLMNFGQYMMGEFGREVASSALPSMRVIPVEKSIEVEHHIATYDELRRIIEQAGEQIAVQECMCRKVADLQGRNCESTDRREVCMSFGDQAELYIAEGWGRRISQAEALDFAQQSQDEGLVLMPGNEQEAAFMCACCSDCCGMLSVIKNFPTPGYMVASNYYAQVNANLCQGTATCVERCPMDAVKLEDAVAVIDLARCIGCGVCVPTCPQNAIDMVQKPQETVPPLTQEDLYDKLLAGRQGR